MRPILCGRQVVCESDVGVLSDVVTRVVKLGGSLLTQETLVPTMLAWIASQPPAQTLVVVGGGEIVDAVRNLDKRYPLPPDQVHWMCVDLLQATHVYAVSMFPQWRSLTSTEELRSFVALKNPTTGLVAVDTFYRPELPEDWSPEDWSPEAKLLPSDWRTTTDALAALLAVLVKADELVLLKSCEIPSVNINELARLGIVDEAVSVLVSQIPRVRVEQLVMSFTE